MLSNDFVDKSSDTNLHIKGFIRYINNDKTSKSWHLYILFGTKWLAKIFIVFSLNLHETNMEVIWFWQLWQAKYFIWNYVLYIVSCVT